MNVCLIGGGAQTHVIAATLASKGNSVNILTRRPAEWVGSLEIETPSGRVCGKLSKVSAHPADVIPDADVILLTVPGYANAQELHAIKPYLRREALVGGVFCSSGFFFEALKVLPETQPLWGFQRVPYIARVEQYGRSARILSTKPELKIAIERLSEESKQNFATWLAESLENKVVLANNYLEVSLTNSNPILHTGRLYTMFADWDTDRRSDHNILFYEEWTHEAAQMIIDMDAELFRLLKVLPVTPGSLLPLLEYYESSDAESLKCKISSITGFKGLTSPMKEDERGWYPDYSSRYFTEDFGYSLRYIVELAHSHGIPVPTLDRVYKWGRSKIQQH